MKRIAILTIALLIGSLTTPSQALLAEGQVQPEVAAKVRSAAENYVKREGVLKGGFFLRDAKSNQVRDLRFDYVHKGVDPAPRNEYAVCVDFLDESKNRLDVDFYLKPTGSGDFEVTKIKVHKVNGVEQKEKK